MTYHKITLPVALLCLLLLTGCSPDDTPEPENYHNGYEPGIVLTFDDTYVNEWYQADQLMDNYNWKATFFITRYAGFSPEEKQRLHELNNKGHEIAGHGLNHLKATDYMAQHGIDAYINDEITPMLSIMEADGFTIRNFAYPYGARNATLDTRLLQQFDIIRGTTYGRLSPQSQNCYYTGNRLVYGLGIDDSYTQSDIEYFKTLMQYAKENGKIIIFYGHKTVPDVSGDYQTSYAMLEGICKYARDNNIRFYTLSELNNLAPL
ncbi:polysaccharide deacetylase family protein [Flavobacterium sp. RHBU_24]|uniref:polysaccharide deacetylase family protein n=1 Tax=Flavobacterium sp. RHBU_24 TaxID=3391185 RepID=UPI003984BFA4